MSARYPVHQLIQDLMTDPVRAAAFAADADAEFDRYGLTEDERALLRDGSKAALHRLGVHANLQMKYARLRSPPRSPAAGGPLAAYLPRLLED